MEPAAAYALAAGVDDNGPGYQVLQVHAGGTSASTGSQGYGAQQEDSDAQMLQDLNGPQVLLQDTGRSQSTGGRLEAASAAAAGAEKGGTLGVVGGWRASSGGRKAGRPNTASAVKPTLFDFTPADPVHAEVHYMRVADQEEFRCVFFCLSVLTDRIGGRPVPAAPTWLALSPQQCTQACEAQTGLCLLAAQHGLCPALPDP